MKTQRSCGGDKLFTENTFSKQNDFCKKNCNFNELRENNKQSIVV